MNTAPVLYSDGKNDVRLGDHVLMRLWFRKVKARVVYVPGISGLNEDFEHHGMTWVGIHIPGGTYYGIVVHNETNRLQKSVTFVGRGSNDVPFVGPKDRVMR